MSDDRAVVRFVGEEYPVAVGDVLTIGRTADVEIDDNPYLHRVLLEVHASEGV